MVVRGACAAPLSPVFPDVVGELDRGRERVAACRLGARRSVRPSSPYRCHRATGRIAELRPAPFRIRTDKPFNETGLRTAGISRQQAQIVSFNGGLMLEDCGSRHGTFVNGEKIVRHELRANDKIDFGIADSYQSRSTSAREPRSRSWLERVEAAGARRSRAPANSTTLAVLLDVARAPGAPGFRSRTSSPPWSMRRFR